MRRRMMPCAAVSAGIGPARDDGSRRGPRAVVPAGDATPPAALPRNRGKVRLGTSPPEHTGLVTRGHRRGTVREPSQPAQPAGCHLTAGPPDRRSSGPAVYPRLLQIAMQDIGQLTFLTVCPFSVLTYAVVRAA